MKVCINCDTENSDDEVFCWECGMSLMGAPTGEEAMKLAEERRAKRREETQRRLEQPLTASGIVYLFGDQFATPPASVPVALARKVILALLAMALEYPRVAEPWLVRVPYSGQQVEPRDLGRKLLEAAFVSLAQEGYVSLGLDKTTNLSYSGEVVAIILEKSGDDLPPSLERSIMDALASSPQGTWLRTLVAGFAEHPSSSVPMVHIVAEALMEMGWLQRGAVRGESAHGKPTEEAAPLLAAVAGEAETVKARLENFAAQNPHLHTRLAQDLAASVT